MAREPTTASVQRDLGLRAKELRALRGWTQEQMAERLGMLTPNYARIEQGRVNATIDTIVRVANALEVPVRELFKAPRARQVRPGRPRGPKRSAVHARSR